MKKFEDILSNKAERTFSQVFGEFGIPKSRNEILPGHFYSFSIDIPNINESWIPRNKEEYKETPDAFITEKQYFDLNPCGLMLYHEKWREFAIMVDLKAINPPHRLKMLAAYYKLATPVIEKLYFEQTSGGKITESLLPFQERGSRNAPFYGITQDLIQRVTGLNLNYSINKYNLEAVSNAKFLDWDRFGELPYARIEERGMIYAPNIGNIADIFSIFEQKQQ